MIYNSMQFSALFCMIYIEGCPDLKENIEKNVWASEF